MEHSNIKFFSFIRESGKMFKSIEKAAKKLRTVYTSAFWRGKRPVVENDFLGKSEISCNFHLFQWAINK